MKRSILNTSFAFLSMLFSFGAHSSVMIYQDSLASGWVDNSWSTSVFYDHSTTVYSGNRSILDSFNSAWSGHWMQNTSGVNISNENTFSFFILVSDTTHASNLYLGFDDSSGSSVTYHPLSNYLPEGFSASTWYEVTVPLSDYPSIGNTVTDIIFQSAIPATVFLDELRFVNVQTVDPGVAYDNELRWSDYSWGSSVDFSSTVRYAGSHGIRVQTNSDWAALWLYKDGCLNTTGYNTLRFALHGGNTGGQTLYAGLTDTNGTSYGYIPLNDYVEGGSVPANEWRQVIIPLAYLNAYASNVCGIAIQSWHPTLFYVDEIMISTQGGTSYWEETQPPPVQASAVIYDDSLGAEWHNASWNTNVNFASPVHTEGTVGIEAKFTANWAGLGFQTEHFDTKDHNALSFFVNGGSSGGQELYVLVYDSDGNQISITPLSGYLDGGVLSPYQWNSILIPLADLNADQTVISSIVIQSTNPTTIHIDHIRFLNSGACQ